MPRPNEAEEWYEFLADAGRHACCPCHDACVRDGQIAEMVAAASAGNQQAWSELVRRYAGLVLSTARSVRLSRQEVEDVSQITWLLLAMHIRDLREPEAISGWLITTAKRESLRMLRHRDIEHAVQDDLLDIPDRNTPAVDEGLLREERRAQVRRGFARLPERCQRLLRLLAGDPPASYSEVSAALGIPMGSIGPIRARCLDRLRRAAGLSTY